ncbi:MAG: hypothetical protein AAB116_09525 [Candidatus Poribacteria bacterium]
MKIRKPSDVFLLYMTLLIFIFVSCGKAGSEVRVRQATHANEWYPTLLQSWLR